MRTVSVNARVGDDAPGRDEAPDAPTRGPEAPPAGFVTGKLRNFGARTAWSAPNFPPRRGRLGGAARETATRAKTCRSPRASATSPERSRRVVRVSTVRDARSDSAAPVAMSYRELRSAPPPPSPPPPHPPPASPFFLTSLSSPLTASRRRARLSSRASLAASSRSHRARVLRTPQTDAPPPPSLPSRSPSLSRTPRRRPRRLLRVHAFARVPARDQHGELPQPQLRARRGLPGLARLAVRRHREDRRRHQHGVGPRVLPQGRGAGLLQQSQAEAQRHQASLAADGSAREGAS